MRCFAGVSGVLLRWTERDIDCILRISAQSDLREFANPTPVIFTYEETEAQRGKEIVEGSQQVEAELEFGSKSPAAWAFCTTLG